MGIVEDGAIRRRKTFNAEGAEEREETPSELMAHGSPLHADASSCYIFLMQSNANVPLIHVEDLKKRLDAGEQPLILDVREPHEYETCNLNGTLIPLGQLQQRLGELDPKRETIVHCRSGMRAADACQFLMQKGFKDVKNLAGGILAWADKIDPTMKKY